MVGTWVVLRGLAFIGDALAHGVLPGVAIAVLVGFDLILGAWSRPIAMVAGINFVHRRARLTEDTAIGLLFVGMLALGVVLISRTSSYTGSLTGILFGDILGVSGSDLVILGSGSFARPPSRRQSSTARSSPCASTSARQNFSG